MIKGAVIIDGTGRSRYKADVGLINGSISFIGNSFNETYIEEINANGYFLTPGFIDVHAHLDIATFLDPRFLPQVTQGITSVAIGMCGLSPAPSSQKTDSPLYKYWKLNSIP